MKKVFVYLGIGAVGYILYKQFLSPQTGTFSVSNYSYPNDAYGTAALGGQPSAQYPYTSITAPRVDNSNQPWYGQSRAVTTNLPTQSLGDTNFLQNVQYAKGTADIAQSVASIWDSLGVGDWFGGSDTSTDAVQFTGGTSYDTDWGSWA